MLKNVLAKKRISNVLVVLLLLFNFMVVMPAMTVNAATGVTYYVDNNGGNDANNGTSQSTPWKTIGKVNSMTFQPGDKILFKKDAIWICDTNGLTNCLKPQGSGTAGSPIIIDMYGTGTNKPLIQGNGYNGTTAVYLANQQYWEINNLMVTNPGSTTNHEKRRGIFVCTWASNFPGSTQASPAVLSHIYVRNCEVKNVNSEVAGMSNYDKYWGGIIFDVVSSSTDTAWVKFDDIRVENNYIHDVYRDGIFVYTDFCRDQPYTIDEGTRTRLPLTNVFVRNNYLDTLGGDGIVVVGANSPLMEYNVVAKPQRVYGTDVYGKNLYTVAIWAFGCYDAIMQFNECFQNQTAGDGQGFDVDYGTKRCIVQYNYSHDNQGGLVLVCSGDATVNGQYMQGTNEDSIVRYNISQNDGAYTGSRIFQISGSHTYNCQIYNNTIYTSTSVPKIVASSSSEWAGAPASVKYSNNIIVNRNPSAVYETTASTTFDYNDFFGGVVPSYSTNHIISDPMLVNPGSGTTGGRIDLGQARGNVDGYKLQAGSPCINTGVAIANNGGKDYWGNTLYNGNPDRGAFETTTGSTTLPSTTWYLYNTAASGVTPAGQSLQTAKSTMTGWQPTLNISTTPSYWYAPAQTGSYNAGNWTFTLWTNQPGSASNVQVSLYKVNSDGSGATQIGTSQTADVNVSGGGNHTTTFNFTSVPSVSLSNQRLMVKIVLASGVSSTMCYNTNDFATKLVTP